jgi:hypothetical protein
MRWPASSPRSASTDRSGTPGQTSGGEGSPAGGPSAVTTPAPSAGWSHAHLRNKRTRPRATRPNASASFPPGPSVGTAAPAEGVAVGAAVAGMPVGVAVAASSTGGRWPT